MMKEACRVTTWIFAYLAMGIAVSMSAAKMHPDWYGVRDREFVATMGTVIWPLYGVMLVASKAVTVVLPPERREAP